jgi:hypothetical protein
MLYIRMLATIKMTKKSKYIIGAATLILIASIFLPSRLTSYDLKTIISFAKTDGIGYAPYILLLFPITLRLVLTKKLKAGFIVSTFLLLINTTLFEDLLYVVFHKSDLTFLILLDRSLPFLLYTAIFMSLFYQVFKKNSWICYGTFICLLIASYIWVNDSNCTIKFISDMGMKTYDLRIWFQNCGTYYAWWTAPILLNIGLFNELKTVANKT